MISIAFHIMPSTPIGVRQRLLIVPEPERRKIFELGYADARRYWRRAALQGCL